MSYAGILDPNALLDVDNPSHLKAAWQLINQEYKSAGFERKTTRGDVRVYGVKTSRGKRIVFAEHKAAKQRHLVVLKVFDGTQKKGKSSHDQYEEYLNGNAPATDYRKLLKENKLILDEVRNISQELLGKAESEAATEKTDVVVSKKYVPYGDVYLSLTVEQERSVEVRGPFSTTGIAGAGKTVSAYEGVRRLAVTLASDSKPILYLGPKKLIEELKKKWKASDQGYAVEVKFMTIEQFALSRMDDSKEITIRSEEYFISEFRGKQRKLAGSKKKLGPEILKKLYLDFKLIAALGEQFYQENIGSRACRFEEEGRKPVVNFYNIYMEKLKKENAFDCQLCQLPDIKKRIVDEDVAAENPDVDADPEYSFIAVDEAQFVPSLWIKDLLVLSGHQLGLFGDSHQVLDDRLPTAKILQWLFPDKRTFQTIELSESLRVPPVIAQVSEAVLEAQNKMIGGFPAEGATPVCKSGVKDEIGSIDFVNSESGEDVAYYKELAKSPDTAFVVFQEKDLKRIRDLYQTGNVFLAKEIVGREYLNVIILLPCLAFINKLNEGGKVRHNFPKDSDKAKSLEPETLEMNALFVALTRALKHVALIYDPNDYKKRGYEYFIKLLKAASGAPDVEEDKKDKKKEKKKADKKTDEKDKSAESEKIERRQTLLNDKEKVSWLAEIIDLYDAGNVAQSRSNFLFQHRNGNPEIIKFENWDAFETWYRKEKIKKEIDSVFIEPVDFQDLDRLAEQHDSDQSDFKEYFRKELKGFIDSVLNKPVDKSFDWRRLHELIKRYFLDGSDIGDYLKEKLKKFIVDSPEGIDYLVGPGSFEAKGHINMMQLAFEPKWYPVFEFLLEVLFLDKPEKDSIADADINNLKKVSKYLFKPRRDGTVLYFEVAKNKLRDHFEVFKDALPDEDKVEDFKRLGMVMDRLLQVGDSLSLFSLSDYTEYYHQARLNEPDSVRDHLYSPDQYFVLTKFFGVIFDPNKTIEEACQIIFEDSFEGSGERTLFQMILHDENQIFEAFSELFFGWKFPEKEENNDRFKKMLEKIFSLKSKDKEIFILKIFFQNEYVFQLGKDSFPYKTLVDLFSTQDDSVIESFLGLYPKAASVFLKGNLLRGGYLESFVYLNSVLSARFPEICRDITTELNKLSSPVKQLYKFFDGDDSITLSNLLSACPVINGKKYESIQAVVDDFDDDMYFEFMLELYAESTESDFQNIKEKRCLLFFALQENPNFIEKYLACLFEYRKGDHVGSVKLQVLRGPGFSEFFLEIFLYIFKMPDYESLFLDHCRAFLKTTREQISSSNRQLISDNLTYYILFIKTLLEVFDRLKKTDSIFEDELRLLLREIEAAGLTSVEVRRLSSDFVALAAKNYPNVEYEDSSVDAIDLELNTAEEGSFKFYLSQYAKEEISLEQLYKHMFSKNAQNAYPFLNLLADPNYTAAIQLFSRGKLIGFIRSQQDQTILQAVFAGLIEGLPKRTPEQCDLLRAVIYKFCLSKYDFIKFLLGAPENPVLSKIYDFFSQALCVNFHVMRKARYEKISGKSIDAFQAPSLEKHCKYLEADDTPKIMLTNFFNVLFHFNDRGILPEATYSQMRGAIFEALLDYKALTERFISQLGRWPDFERFVSKIWGRPTLKTKFIKGLLSALDGLNDNSTVELFESLRRLFVILKNKKLTSRRIEKQQDNILQKLSDLSCQPSTWLYCEVMQYKYLGCHDDLLNLFFSIERDKKNFYDQLTNCFEQLKVRRSFFRYKLDFPENDSCTVFGMFVINKRYREIFFNFFSDTKFATLDSSIREELFREVEDGILILLSNKVITDKATYLSLKRNICKFSRDLWQEIAARSSEFGLDEEMSVEALCQKCYECDTSAEMVGISSVIKGNRYGALLDAFNAFDQASHLDFIRVFYSEQPFQNDSVKSDLKKRELFTLLLNSPVFIEAHIKYLFQYVERDNAGFIGMIAADVETDKHFILDVFDSIFRFVMYTDLLFDHVADFIKAATDAIFTDFLFKHSVSFFGFVSILSDFRDTLSVEGIGFERELMQLHQKILLYKNDAQGELPKGLDFFLENVSPSSGSHEVAAGSNASGVEDNPERSGDAKKQSPKKKSNITVVKSSDANFVVNDDLKRDPFYEQYILPFARKKIGINDLYQNLTCGSHEGDLPLLILLKKAKKYPVYQEYLRIFGRTNFMAFLAAYKDRENLLGFFEECIAMFFTNNFQTLSENFANVLCSVIKNFLGSSGCFIRKYGGVWSKISDDAISQYNIKDPSAYVAERAIQNAAKAEKFGYIDSSDETPSFDDCLKFLEGGEFSVDLEEFLYDFFYRPCYFSLLPKSIDFSVFKALCNTFLSKESFVKRSLEGLFFRYSRPSKNLLSSLFSLGERNLKFEYFIKQLWNNQKYLKFFITSFIGFIKAGVPGDRESFYHSTKQLLEILCNERLFSGELIKCLKEFKKSENKKYSDFPEELSRKISEYAKGPKRLAYLTGLSASINELSQDKFHQNLNNLFESSSSTKIFFSYELILQEDLVCTVFYRFVNNIGYHQKFFSYFVGKESELEPLKNLKNYLEQLVSGNKITSPAVMDSIREWMEKISPGFMIGSAAAEVNISQAHGMPSGRHGAFFREGELAVESAGEVPEAVPSTGVQCGRHLGG